MAGRQINFETATGYEDALSRAAYECGIAREYWDIFHKKHETPVEVLKSVLAALGWDISSRESIEQGRRRRFLGRAAAVLPRTLVLSEVDKHAPLTLLGQGAVGLDLELEDGRHIGASAETSQLELLHEIELEGQRWLTFRLPLPMETPLGYHTLRIWVNGEFAGQANLIVCPERAYLPERLAHGGKTAGFNIALYGLRSKRNWGCGDFTDLEGLAEWARAEAGFSFIGLNPLHALHNRAPYNTSPYLPLSVYYRNFIYVDIERVAEFGASRCAQALFQSAKIQQQIGTLRAAEFVAYQDVDRLKKSFLKVLYREFRRGASGERARAFAEYRDSEGDLLHKFALYCALDEILHKEDRRRWTWRDWPAEYRSPDSEASRQFAERYARTVDFYKYVQFVIDEQLAAAQRQARNCGMEIGLYHDLAVATDSCGADLWAHGGFFVSGCRVGAPPDDFSPNGQDWGFPPPDREAHFENGYQLYRESIRKILRHGGALRIDHVMRLFRLFWIPEHMTAGQGTYVRDYATDLMRILALESVRSGNVIIGEDLGTVTDEIRDMLAEFRILSYRLFYFEKHPHGGFKQSWEYPQQALVSSSTHDLPTIAGFWESRDIEARKAAGLADEAGYWGQMNDRKREKQNMLDTLHREGLLPHGYERNAGNLPELNGELHNAVVGFLAQTPAKILLVNQEDLTKETEQQNLPGSTAQYPNWQRKMRISIEELRSPGVRGVAAMFRDQLARTGRG